MQNVNRNSPNDKLTGILDTFEELKTEMLHMAKLKQWPIHFTQQRLDYFGYLSTGLAFAINIAMLFKFQRSYVIDPNDITQGKSQFAD